MICRTRRSSNLVAQPRQLLVDLGEHVLEHVLGVLVGEPERLHADGVHVARESLDEIVPRRGLPGPAAGHQAGIGPRVGRRLHGRSLLAAGAVDNPGAHLAFPRGFGEDGPVGPEPEIRYARSGGVAIAYQVLGAGDVDLVYVPDYVSNLVYAWEIPLFRDSTSGSPGNSG